MVTLRSYARLLKAPEQSFFLFGMRGVGKSTWSWQAFTEAHRFDLLDEGLFQDYLRDTRLFGRELLRIPRGRTVVVDEVQRLPAILSEVHRFIESHNMRFVLLVVTCESGGGMSSHFGRVFDACNGLLRQYIPKGRSLDDIGERRLDAVCERLTHKTSIS